MTWSRQVWHVLRKDVNEHQRLLVTYVVIVAIAIGRAVGWRALTSSSSLGMLLVISMFLLSIAIVGSLVQGDSPRRSDAFWTSHPLYPSAIVVAKLALLLLIVATPVLGQAVVLRSYDVSGVAAMRDLTEPTALFAALLLAAMAIAALTRDLRSFALAVVGLPVLLVLLIALLSTDSGGLGSLAWVLSPLKWVFPLAELAVIAWLYRTRDSRLVTQLGGFALVMLALAAATLPQPPANRTTGAANASVPHVPITLEAPPNGRIVDGSRLTLNLVMPAQRGGNQSALRGATAVVELRDGTSFRAPLLGGSFRFGIPEQPRMPNIPGTRWLDETPDAVTTIPLTTQLSPDQRRAVEAGYARITVEGTVVITGSHAEAELPLATGRASTRAGARVRIDDWSYRNGEPNLTVHTTRLTRAPGAPIDEPTAWSDGVAFALVNQERHEGLALNRLQLSVALEGAVLPTMPMRAETAEYRVAGATSLVDDAWLRGARLLTVTRVTLGSYRVRLELPSP